MSKCIRLTLGLFAINRDDVAITVADEVEKVFQNKCFDHASILIVLPKK